MNYILKGTLNALAWEDCIESLPNVIVKIYDVKDRANLDDLLIKGKKSILVLDSEEMQHEKEKHLLGEGLTNINGNFEIGLNTEKYHGGAFEIAIYCASVPGQKNGTDHHKSIEFVVATLLPTWEVTQGIMISHWNYELPFGFWRYILSLFDVWVIYGKVVSSRNPKIPIIGVEVTAHDADWISENHLGTSYTDKSGHFRIYYTSHDFNRTSLATGGVNISITDVYSGPDVYFTVKTSAGILLIDETKVDGRKPERSNIGNCHCMTMSIREGQGVEIKGMDSTWTGIGAAFAIPSGDEMNDFDPNGYAGIMKYAITGNVRLTGRKMHKVGPHPLEYRFLISKSTGVNGAPALPKSRFNLIVGRDPGLFVETKIGQMWKFSPTFKIVNIYVKQVDIDKDGWFDVSRAVERTFRDDESLHIAELADPNLWRWVDFDGMMAINTKMLTVARDIPLSELKAGNDISSSERIPIEKIAIRFEIREVIDRAKAIFNDLPGTGQTLNALLINNNSSVKLLAIKELIKNKADAPLSNDVHVLYTTYHPHLRDVSINIRKNNEVTWNGLSDVTVPLTSNNNPAINLCHNSKGIRIPQSLLNSSGIYVVMMYLTRRLHNGDEAIATEWIDASFIYHKELEAVEEMAGESQEKSLSI